ncbi:MAG: glycosyltransferase [Bacillota bacterium]
MSGIALSLCMIARNEGPNLERALKSLDGVADELLVVDTGSTDGTAALAAALGARVLHFAWTGSFADARNYALEQARGEWALIMDADEELHPDDRERLRALLGEAGVEGYAFTVLSYLGASPGAEVLTDHRLCLLRRRPAYRYSGAIHESVREAILAASPGARILDAPVRLLHYGYLEGELVRKQKRERNRRILERHLADHPDDGFALYGLAIELLGSGEADQARRLLEAALAQAGPTAHYRADILRKLADCARLAGDEAGEERWLRQGAEEYPDYTDLWFCLAEWAARGGRWREAEALLRLCLALGEPPPQYQSRQGCGSHLAWALLARVYEHLASPRAAQRACLGWLRAQPRSPAALSSLIRLLGAEPVASAAAELSAAFDLTNAATVHALALHLRRQGRPLHAHALLGRARAAPTPEIYQERAALYLAGALGALLPHDAGYSRLQTLCESIR